MGNSARRAASGGPRRRPQSRWQNVAQLTTGNDHTCAITSAGAAFCWGDNTNGQLGDGTTKVRATPTPIPTLANVSAISAGDQFTCGVSGNAAYCWGIDDSGQIGDGGGSADQVTPLVIKVGTSAPARTMSAPAVITHACRRQAPASTCWGLNTDGQIGNNRVQPPSSRSSSARRSTR